MDKIEKIRKHFSLFPEVEERGDKIYVRRRANKPGGSYIPKEWSWPNIRKTLVPRHRRLSMKTDLEEHYQYLTVLVLENHVGAKASLWVKDSGTAINTKGMYVHEPDFHTRMSVWNAEARKASQDDMFFCSGHQRAEPKENYSYYYFAGKFCEEWKENHPDHYKKAQNETYR